MNIPHPIDSDEDLDRAEICQLDANNPVSYVNYLVTRLPLNEYATNFILKDISGRLLLDPSVFKIYNNY